MNQRLSEPDSTLKITAKGGDEWLVQINYYGTGGLQSEMVQSEDLLRFIEEWAESVGDRFSEAGLEARVSDLESDGR